MKYYLKELKICLYFLQAKRRFKKIMKIFLLKLINNCIKTKETQFMQFVKFNNEKFFKEIIAMKLQ